MEEYEGRQCSEKDSRYRRFKLKLRSFKIASKRLISETSNLSLVIVTLKCLKISLLKDLSCCEFEFQNWHLLLNI